MCFPSASENAVFWCQVVVPCKCHQPEICFWLYCGSTFFITLSELRFVKWVIFFERSCIVKWVDIFASFCWLWDFLPENLRLADKLQTFIFWSKFHFSVRFYSVLASVILHFFFVGQPWWPTLLPRPPAIKKLPTLWEVILKVI